MLCNEWVKGYFCVYSYQLTAKPPNVEIYQEYIEYEQKSNQPARVQCIFERALKDNCLVADLWLQYTKYLVMF